VGGGKEYESFGETYRIIYNKVEIKENNNNTLLYII
jgi:hypothetical protein